MQAIGYTRIHKRDLRDVGEWGADKKNPPFLFSLNYLALASMYITVLCSSALYLTRYGVNGVRWREDVIQLTRHGSHTSAVQHPTHTITLAMSERMQVSRDLFCASRWQS